LHRSTLKYLLIFRLQNFFHQISSFFANFESIPSVFEQILMKIYRNFTGLKNASQNFGEISNFDEQASTTAVDRGGARLLVMFEVRIS